MATFVVYEMWARVRIVEAIRKMTPRRRHDLQKFGVMNERLVRRMAITYCGRTYIVMTEQDLLLLLFALDALRAFACTRAA